MSNKKTILKAAAGAIAAGAAVAGAFAATRNRERGEEREGAGKPTVRLPKCLAEAGFPLPEFHGVPAGEAGMYSVSADGMDVWYDDVRRADVAAWLSGLAAEGRDVRYKVEEDGCCFACAEGDDPRRGFQVWLVSDIDDGFGDAGDDSVVDMVEIDIPRSFFDAAGAEID